jgi:hypothetical protein
VFLEYYKKVLLILACTQLSIGKKMHAWQHINPVHIHISTSNIPDVLKVIDTGILWLTTLIIP